MTAFSATESDPRWAGRVLLVMGVSGSGKSSLARALADDLGGRYLDADDFHPPENVAKMRSGQALDDHDRAAWLAQLNERLREGVREADTPQVLACSALKQIYRDRLREGIEHFHIVWLDGPREILEQRLTGRKGHFMPASLLDSQLSTLEDPTGPEVCRVELAWPLERAVAVVRETLVRD